MDLAADIVNPSAGLFHATCDGHGNVTEYVDVSGDIEASFAYDAFGNMATSVGSDLERLSQRFSSKYLDQTPGLYYYGYRYYTPTIGRWECRDPFGEVGGSNLFGFSRNCPTDFLDYLGLRSQPYDWHHNFAKAFEAYFNKKGIDINSGEFGVLLLWQDHQSFKQAFHNEWENFVYSEKGGKATRECLIKHFNEVIKPKFSSEYSKAVPANVNYGNWRSMSPSSKLTMASKKFVRLGAAVGGFVAFSKVISAADWLDKEDRGQKMAELVKVMSSTHDRSLLIYLWAKESLPSAIATFSGTLVNELDGKPALSPEVASRLINSFQGEPE